jgi:MFS family permease
VVEGAPAGHAGSEAGEAMGSTLGQLREGIAFIRANPRIAWSLVYLGIAASLIGVLGVLGPTFATQTLGLEAEDFVVVVLPLAVGIVMGILILNNYGHLLPRRRIIEVGLVSLGVMLFLIAAAGRISAWLQHAEAATGLTSLSGVTSLLAIVVFVALLAGIAYAFVAIPAQTQLQEELPEDVRGRVFGVLNMLVSTASFLPIIIVGPIADVVGTTLVIYVVAVLIALSGIVSIVKRGPLKPAEARLRATGPAQPAGLDPIAVAAASEMESHERRSQRRTSGSAGAAPAAADAGTATGDEMPPDARVPAAGPDRVRGDPAEDE